MRSKELISIIIANYNGERYLNDCLNSVLNSNYKQIEIIIVDDGSTDKSLKIVEKFLKQDKRIRLFKNKKNLGASASRNRAIKKVSGEVIIFLDNDTEVEPDWINHLLNTLNRSRQVGATQALLLDFHKRDKIQMAGGKLIPQVAWLAPFNQWDSYKEVIGKLQEREIVAISAALAVKKEVIDKVGGFDEKEAVTTEDLDFCWRIWIAGYKILLSPKARVYHYTRSVEDRKNMNVDYQKVYFHLAKNSFRSIIKNYQILNMLKYFIFSLVINFGRGVVFILSRKSFSALIGTTRALFWIILNLPDTILSRHRINSNRSNTDSYLFNRIFIRDSFIDVYKKYYS